MNLKGASTVGVVLIVLLSIVAVGIFLSAVFRNIKDATAQERAKCLGIDLKVTECIIFPEDSSFPNSNYVLPDDGIYAIIDRGYGGGLIGDLRFQVNYDDGTTEVLRPVNLSGPGFKIETGYQSFVEHSSSVAALMPVNYDPLTNKIPVTLGVSAVVGKSNTICDVTALPTSCAVFASPQGAP